MAGAILAALGCLTSVLLIVGSATAQPPPTSEPAAPPAPTTTVSTPPMGSGGTGDEIVETQWGPLGPADRDLLFKVRQAGLWELPAGQQAAQKSTNPKFLEAGKHLIEGHTLLDKVVLRAGTLLGVELPTEANADQKGWLAEMAAAQADEFEVVFANRLRSAHGKVYGFAAEMRAGTRNELIRILANQTMVTVLDHIKVLEATGRVDFNSIPSPSVAAPAPSNAGDAPADGAEPTAGLIPRVPPDSRFTRTAESGNVTGLSNNTVFVGALVVLVGALASLRVISRTKRTRRKSRAL